MGRKWVCLVWAVCMVMGSGTKAFGAEETGTIRILPQWDGHTAVGTMVQICKVGTVTDQGYRFTDGLADWTVEKEELNEGDWLQWMIQQDSESDAVCTAGEEGAVFRDLPSGVYLVRQLAGDWQGPSFAPFFLTLPEGECWDVCRRPQLINFGEIPKTGDRPTPLIGAMGIGLSVAFLMVFVDEHRK